MYMKPIITAETIQQLNNQLENPKHCHIRMGSNLFRHNCKDPNDFLFELHGKPVRFTRMAAERVVKQMKGSKTEEIKEDSDV